MAPQGSRVRAGLKRAFCLFVLGALMAVMVPLAPPPAHAIVLPQEYWVDIVNGSDSLPNDGSETAPFKTISHAASVATSYDTIWVEPGTYSETNGETLQIVLGGQTLISTEGAASTIIDGEGATQLLIINSWSSGDRLEGFTFRNAATGPAVMVSSGSTLAPEVPLVIADNVFSSNAMGALVVSFYTAGSAMRLAVEGNTFQNNSATTGGAIKHDSYGSIDITGNAFSGNEAQAGGAVALITWDATCTVEANSFVGNEASISGGAVYWNSHGSALTHSIAANTFESNTAGTNGGALYLYHVRVAVRENEAEANTANQGGFAYLEQGRCTAENNYLTANSATTYGAVWNLDSTSSLDERNDTVYAQTSGPQAVRLVPGEFAWLNITNCIYWNPSLAAEIVEATSVSYTCSSDDAATLETNGSTVGAGMVYADPAFDTGIGAPLLDDASPCIDGGDDTDYPDVDFYYADRPVDGDGDGTATPDIGCVEFVPVGIMIQEDAKGVYFGRLIRGVGAAYSGGAYVYGYSKAPYTGTRFETSFTGSTVRWIGPRQPNYGQAKVYLDGVYVTTVDCYAAPGDAAISATLWESTDLVEGAHTIAIEMGSTKNAASSNYIVVIDKIEVEGEEPLGPVGVRENETTGTFLSGWVKNLPNTTYTYGTYAYSYWAGARFVRNFYGTRVAWVGPKIHNYGRAAVYIDGVYKGTVSQYAPGDDIGFRRKVWESAVLPAGNHTLEIRVLGTKDAASTGYFIVVDSIDVTRPSTD